MARGGRTKGEGESISAYFRRLFAARPNLLKKRKNTEILEQWKLDHSGKEPDQRVKQNLANIKSVLRSKRRRKRQMATEGVDTAAVALVRIPRSGLESLEERIDDSLILARSLGATGLEDIIKLLRRARNEVVLKLG